ncbi:AMP-binding protein [Miltoncostaea marina]|uniref:AMP-binding protein n=1 Tax=Miltoncostaea marina TaxID=2843215 RepID=UPI001C3E22EB|nr:AMP-binding protein [Miltoncostaea marina]
MSEWSDWYRREDPTGWVLPAVLRRRAEAHPDRDYLRVGEGPWISYGEMDLRANRVANALIARGLRRGETVSTLMPNCEENLAAWFGIQRAGGVQCPINLAYRGDFLSWVINLPRSRFLVIDASLLDRLELVAGDLPHLEHVFVLDRGVREGPDPAVRWEPFGALLDAPDGDPGMEPAWTDDARVMFTSGTTGRSKGAIKQHASDYFSGRTYIEVCGVTEEDTFFSCLPLFHSNAQVLAAYPAMIAGARIAFVERYSSARFWSQVVDAGATILNTVSAINYFIWNTPPGELDRAHTVSRIMAMPAPRDIYTAFEERFGIRFIEGYGLTETGMVTYHPPGRPPRPGSCGIATPGFEVSVVEPGTDLPVPPGTPGEIVVDMKMPNIVMRTYAGMPEKTAEDFRNLKLHTGDLGRMDEEGYLWFLDRVKDYIRRRGENVSSVEVEHVLTSHPDVLEAAAVGVKAGEGASAEDEILACLVLRAGRAPDLGALLDWCAERMPYFAVPRYVRVLDALPKTPTERVRKVELRAAGVTADTFDRMAAGTAPGR